jgi:hypothetical protein
MDWTEILTVISGSIEFLTGLAVTRNYGSVSHSIYA